MTKKSSPALLQMMAKDRNLSRLGIRKSFKDFCESGGREDKERLESLLIQPVQRVPRYVQHTYIVVSPELVATCLFLPTK